MLTQASTTGEGPEEKALPTEGMTVAERSIQDGIKALASALTDPREEQRQAAIVAVRDRCLPTVQAEVIGELIKAVKAEQSASNLAVASLAALSPFPFPDLVAALESARKPACQLRLLQALDALLPNLDGTLRFRLRQTLLKLWFQFTDPEVQQATSSLIGHCVWAAHDRTVREDRTQKLQAAFHLMDTLIRRQNQLEKE